jgi:hypothetical protein
MPEKQVYRVGNRVRFRFGPNRVNGVVKEDRGSIGKDGRRLYRVQFVLEPPTQFEVELPADELELVQDGTAAR